MVRATIGVSSLALVIAALACGTSSTLPSSDDAGAGDASTPDVGSGDSSDGGFDGGAGTNLNIGVAHK